MIADLASTIVNPNTTYCSTIHAPLASVPPTVNAPYSATTDSHHQPRTGPLCQALLELERFVLMLPPSLSPKQPQRSSILPSQTAAVGREILPFYPGSTLASISQAPQTFDVSQTVTSYFPTIPAPDRSYFPPSAPAVCSPLPPATPPAFLRRPSSAGHTFGPGRPALSISTGALYSTAVVQHPGGSHDQAGPRSAKGATVEAGVGPAQTSPISPVSATSTRSRLDQPEFQAYAASRIAQAAAAASAAKEAAVAKLHAKHTAWARTAHSQILSVATPINSAAPLRGSSRGEHTDSLAHKHQRSASAGSAFYAQEQQSEFPSAPPTTEASSRRATDAGVVGSSSAAVPSAKAPGGQQSNAFARFYSSSPGSYIDYSSINITGLTPSTTPSLHRPSKRPSQGTSTASSSSSQLLTPTSNNRNSSSRLSSASNPLQSQPEPVVTFTYDSRASISPTIFQRGNSIWTADLQQSASAATPRSRARQLSTSAGNSSQASPFAIPADEKVSFTGGPVPKMSSFDTNYAGAAGGLSTSPTNSQSAGTSKGPKKKMSVNKDGTPREGKRKKVSKACLACQKSHLTCDEREYFFAHRQVRL